MMSASETRVEGWRLHAHGGPEALEWSQWTVPAPAAGQVLLRHTAVAVNYRDVLVRSGAHAVKAFPIGLGLESAGVIEAIGPGVQGLTVGQRVACVAGPDGAYATARLVPAARVVPLPNAIDDRTAAAMMIRGMTARYLLRDTYAVQPGDTILIHAAAGGVGLIVCQWARRLGATVIGTVGSRDKAAIAAAHGCDHPIVYTEEDFVARVREITGGTGVPVVYDSVGKATFEGSLACLRPRGVLASFGEASGDPDPIAPRRLGQLGSIFLTHPSLPDYTATREALLACANDLFAQVASGLIRIPVHASLSLREAPAAHRLLESRATSGSVVLIA
jgi:NADPH2:quinone reductase